MTVAQNSAFSSLNANTTTGNSTYNQNIIYMTSSGFNYYDNTPALVKNTKFGTYTKVSDNPLTIKYTINKGVKWSDGTPVNASDMLLNWASSITKYNDPKGVNFTSVYAGTGFDLITKTPEISDNGQSITFVYDKPYVDWELQPIVNMPAASTWELAGIDSKKGKAAQDAVVKAIQDNDTATLTKLATAWATGFNFEGMPSNKAALVTDGPYVISKLVKNQYVTLTANPAYNWGPKTHVSKITVRFIADQTAQVQALSNGEVNIIYGQATSDTVKALSAVKGVTTTTTPTSDYEHIDLTFNNKGPFDPATYGGDAAKALLVRQAFLKSIPRDQIIERLIKPLASNIKPDNSQTFIPGQDGYDASVAANGSSDYATLDNAGAKALLAKAGVKTPVTVKFAYANDNPRRAGEFQLLQAAAKASGFNVVDVGKPTADFFGANGLGSGKYNYDATVFAWSYTSLARTGAESQFITGGNSNFNGYSNKTVDADFKALETEQDNAKQIALLQDVDKQAWGDAMSMILFQLPDVTAHSNTVENVSDAPLVPNVFWNFFDWTVKK
ncbi:ABC transporter substrate-binding protein [Galbitalea soli]|uniref:ABC transporter family substrate-binding protein n=1 Tax=Galbitalea soli TaxID=1268042 RepID=A0A7C9TQH3_9MICO|nr:ABC transporter family substrate-binding protein [Galbitalea soli]NYJ31342.1 peptide/nickel transport system substrate-binding protein [Galbitalea soli]